jgi:hypothetical protein
VAQGKLSLDNVTDEQFAKLLQIKDKTDGSLALMTNQAISPIFVNVGGKNTPGFNGIVLQFSDPKGIKAAAEILDMLAT